jgi:hypothetical protein
MSVIPMFQYWLFIILLQFTHFQELNKDAIKKYDFKIDNSHIDMIFSIKKNRKFLQTRIQNTPIFNNTGKGYSAIIKKKASTFQIEHIKNEQSNSFIKFKHSISKIKPPKTLRFFSISAFNPMIQSTIRVKGNTKNLKEYNLSTYSGKRLKVEVFHKKGKIIKIVINNPKIIFVHKDYSTNDITFKKNIPLWGLEK